MGGRLRNFEGFFVPESLGPGGAKYNPEPSKRLGGHARFYGPILYCFRFFKLLDLKGFPDSFHMYDLLAKLIPAYAWVYPFIGLARELLFLLHFQVLLGLILTILVLGGYDNWRDENLTGQEELSMCMFGHGIEIADDRSHIYRERHYVGHGRLNAFQVPSVVRNSRFDTLRKCS